MPAFITIRFLDILDIILVAILLYQLYRLIKGTVAFNIVIGLFSLYLLWVMVRALNMQLVGAIMGRFIEVGVLALIIVFHPEIRKFLVFVGTNYNLNRVFSLDRLFNVGKEASIKDREIEALADACFSLSKSKTGALIVIAGNSELNDQINTGELMNAEISSSLLRTIFFKNTPLHDGAVIIKNNKIAAAGCILPLTQRDVDKSLGLRHRAAIGITENTDAITIIVSEERGSVSFVKEGDIKRRVSREVLIEFLEEQLGNNSAKN
ncbi:TIGR00159 family protein [Tangfeifania diversioriginum]|uniref:Diadenylate cyclase n=1 Tax=Tangfeifania diversioriginum TaxID=1168035 RepID=A0A1M6CUK0_9BACT|nr:diadenylate cyclase CdaA [Tangfeifania diversioriginum]SHI64629.1 TIGR00159 family protein [Tangfeifania diversioriginum]